jgi:putative redox protein
MRAVGTWQGGYQTLLEDEDGHSITVDLPANEGGTDAGPSALKLSVLSLAGCIATIFALVAKKRRLRFLRMKVEIAAERPAKSPTITSVNGVLHVVSSADPSDVETALNITLRTCPVGVIFDRAGIPVRVRLDLTSPAIPGVDPSSPAQASALG